MALVFERVIHEDEQIEMKIKDQSNANNNSCNLEQQQNGADTSIPVQDGHQQPAPKALSLPTHLHHQYNGSNVSGGDIVAVSALGPCAADAYLMFQVIHAAFCFQHFKILIFLSPSRI